MTQYKTRRIFVRLALVLCTSPLLSAQTTWFVDGDAAVVGGGTSWADAFQGLRPALLAAQPGDAVWVAEGTYGPTSLLQRNEPRSATVGIPAGLSVFGGFDGTEQSLSERDPAAHPTVLSGELGGPSPADNSWHVVTIIGPGATTVLDSLIIRDGNADGVATADKRGGGIQASGVDLQLVGCTLTENLAEFLAGGLSCDGSDVLVDGCTFTANTSGMRLSGGASVVRDTLFDGNGAAIFFLSSSEFDVSGCEFRNGGGGISVNSAATGLITDSLFQSNDATSISGSGAGAFRVEHCRFEDNVTQGSGGAVNISQSPPGITFADCDFVNNSCQVGGGAMFLNGTVVDIQSCRFVGNTAVNSGGAVTFWLESLGGMTGSRVTGCVFLGNEASEGGAVAANGGQAGLSNFGSSPVLAGCLLSGNTAQRGGAFYVDGESEPRLVNSTLVGNVATLDGGGMYSTLAGFVAPVGIPLVRLDNTIVYGNTDGGGQAEAAQIFVAAGGWVVQRCCVQGWTGDLGGVVNHGLDPLFADADGLDDVAGTEDDDATLLAGSPCIDAGDASVLVADSADLDCDGDVAEMLSLDLGLVRRIDDDPATADTGVGPGAIIDIGAYEASAWSHLGEALAGTKGEPCLVGEGTLVGNTLLGLSLANAAESSFAVLFIGLGQVDVPFLGGVLVPSPDARVFLGTDASGALDLAATFPPGSPSGASLWFQYWIADGEAPFGFAASNAVVATTP